MTTSTNSDRDDEAMLAEDPKALAAYGVESQEISKLIDRRSGCLDTDGDLRVRVDRLRDEWR